MTRFMVSIASRFRDPLELGADPGNSGRQRVTAVVISERNQVYAHIGRVLRRFSIWRLGKPDKGLLRHDLERTTGLSRAQLRRLVARYLAEG